MDRKFFDKAGWEKITGTKVEEAEEDDEAVEEWQM